MSDSEQIIMEVISARRKSEIVKLCCWGFSLLYLCGLSAPAAFREESGAVSVSTSRQSRVM